MPPLRSGRSSKACESCRKQKTRCYPSTSELGNCLRCETLGHPCSLQLSSGSGTPNTSGRYPGDRQSTHHARTDNAEQELSASVNERLEQLESTLATLVHRMDQNTERSEQWRPCDTCDTAQQSTAAHTNEPDTAPVFLIRDAATDLGIHSPEDISAGQEGRFDIISSGLIDLSTARSLLEIFRIHYGRWIVLPDMTDRTALLSQSRKSPLLLCSMFLIAVRHTSQELANNFAPVLFDQAKTLVMTSLLVPQQSVEFFQAVLILSMWSTTIGQVPLSVDGWLLTSYALQQGLSSPVFASITDQTGSRARSVNTDMRCLWTHLCLTHLHHCVGTRRPAMLSQQHIQYCSYLTTDEVPSNFESRMVAEVQLYWLIYQMFSTSPPKLLKAKRDLNAWQQKYAMLFNQPRSQFLQLGRQFANLLTQCEALKVSGPTANTDTLKGVIESSKAMIDVFIDTADDRTRHLSDHIYHVVTFAALTLCRLLQSYGAILEQAGHDRRELYLLVEQIITELGAVGLPCHAAHMLASIVAAKFKALPNDFEGTSANPGNDAFELTEPFQAPGDYWSLDDFTFMYPDFSNSGPFDMT